MAINAQELVMSAREQLTELPDAVHFSEENLFALIQPAIALWLEEMKDDPEKLQSFTKTSAPIPMVNGVVDLSGVLESDGYKLDWLRDGDVILAYVPPQIPEFTVKFVNSRNRLHMKGRQDKFFHLAYLDGSSLIIKDASGPTGSRSGTVTISSVVMPDLDTIPKSMMPELSTAVARLARQETMEQNRGLNIPPI